MNNNSRQSGNQQAQWHTLSDDLMNLSTEEGSSQPEQEAGQHPRTYQGDSDQGHAFENSIPWQGLARETSTIGITKNKHADFSQDSDNDQNRKDTIIERDEKKYWPIVLAMAMFFVLIGGGIFSYFNIHLWEDATCTTPEICRICGKTQGNTLAHYWTSKDCTSPEICSVCGKTGSQAAGHKWTPATCSAPETCSVCGTTRGIPASHSLTTQTYHDYSHNKVVTERSCSQCGFVAGSTSEELTTLLDSQNERFMLPAFYFYQRLLYAAPKYDMLDGISFEMGTADTSQLGEKAGDFTPPITVRVMDGDAQCATFMFGNYHGSYVTEWDVSIDAPFTTITLMMDYEEASSTYAQLPMLLIAACDPTMDAGGMDTMLLAMTAFSGEGGVEHNGIYYSRVEGFFQATCVGAIK